MQSPPPPLRDSLILVGALLLVHVLLVFNHGFYTDDWVMFRIAPDYPVDTGFLIHGAGHPFLFLYVTLANLSGHPAMVMNLMAMAAIVIGSWNLRRLLGRLRLFSDFEAGVFAFLVWSYAGYQTWATKVVATYLFSFAMLCLGLNLLSVLVEAGPHRRKTRAAALVAIFCSFSLNSMMVAYAIGFFAIVVLQGRGHQARLSPVLSRVASGIRSWPDFLALPFVYWILVNQFFPKTGPYKSYYMPRIPGVGELIAGLNGFWTFGFRKVIQRGLDLMIRDSLPVLVIALLIAVVLVVALARNRSLRSAASGGTVVAMIWPVLAAPIVFVLFAMPYLMSGIRPDGHFYESRHLILFGIPNALLLVSFFRCLALLPIPRSIGYGLIAIVLSVSISALWSGYINQQARWLRLEALMQNLRKADREAPATVFDLSDGFLEKDWHTYYGFPELTGALHLIWGARPQLAFTGSRERSSILQDIVDASRTDGSTFRGIDPSGPQATIIFEPIPPLLDNYQLARSYYLCLVMFCDATALIGSIAAVGVRIGPIANIAPLVRPRE